MTYEEALKLFNDVEFADKYQGLGQYTDMLLRCKEALEKADKYKWHTDNPSECGKYLVAYDCFGRTEYSVANYGHPCANGFGKPIKKMSFYLCDSEYGDYVLDDVLAWKEIEPYEVEK